MKTIIRRIIKILLIVFSLSMVFLAAANIVVYSSAKNSIVTADEAENYDSDCILVLGAGVREDGTPSLMLRDRLLTAIELYENGGAPKLLMSGDHGRVDYNEVECMKNFAVEHGVPEDDIFLDHAGFCTYDSVVRAKEVFGAEKIIVVTQKYHIYRAIYIVKCLYIEYGYSLLDWQSSWPYHTSGCLINKNNLITHRINLIQKMDLNPWEFFDMLI